MSVMESVVRHTVIWAVIGAVLGFAANANATDRTAQDLMRVLRDRHAALAQGFTMTTSVQRPVSLTLWDLGTVTRTCIVTRDGDTRGLAAYDPIYDSSLQYRPLGYGDYQPVDYDGDDNLIIWRPVEKYALQTPEFNETLSIQTSSVVTPENVVLETVPSPMRSLHVLDDDESMYEFDRVLLAAGIGLHAFIDSATVTAVSDLEDGILELHGEGLYGPTISGTWDVAIDPDAGHLVRHAQFIPKGDEVPMIAIATEGLKRHAGIALPERGKVTFFPGQETEYETVVAFNDFQLKADSNFLRELRAKIEKDLPPGSEIMDYRTDPGKPTRIMVD